MKKEKSCEISNLFIIKNIMKKLIPVLIALFIIYGFLKLIVICYLEGDSSPAAITYFNTFAIAVIALAAVGILLIDVLSHNTLCIEKAVNFCPVCGKYHNIHIRAKEPIIKDAACPEYHRYIYKWCPLTERIIKIYHDEELKEDIKLQYDLLYRVKNCKS